MSKLTVQEMILTLQKFWSDNGCMLMQAYDTEKGAGTMSPYTFYELLDQNHGVPLMLSHHVVQRMVVMGKIQTACINTINSKW